MIVSTKAIVLQSIKYQEKSLIVKCFTEKEGINTFFVKNAFSKSKSQSISYFQPLTLLNISYKEKKNNQLTYFSSLSLHYSYVSLHTDFNKSMVVMFLTEVLNQVLKDEQHRENLYTYLEKSFIWFDTAEWNPDFHIYFLFQLTKYLGFYPDDSHTKDLYFDKREGCFKNDYNPDCLNEDETLSFKKGLNITLTKPSGLNGSERKKILDLLLGYFQLHTHQSRQIHSLQVMNELF